MSSFKNYDVLISIFAALSIPAIGVFRQVCRETLEASRQWTVWYNAYNIHILQKGIPCPRSDLKFLSASELERQTIRAYLLRENASSPNYRMWEEPWTIPYGYFTKFVKTQSRTWVVHLLGSDAVGHPYTVCLLDCATGDVVSWYYIGDVIDVGLVVNSNPYAEAALGFSTEARENLQFRRSAFERTPTMTRLLSIHEDHTTSTVSLDCVYRMEGPEDLIALHGDMLAFSRVGAADTLFIKNWKTEDPPLKLTGIVISDIDTVTFIGQDILVIGKPWIYRFMPPYKEPRRTLTTYSRTVSFSFEPVSSEKGLSSSLTSILVQENEHLDQRALQLFKIPDLPDGEGERAGGPFAPLVQMSMGNLSCMQHLAGRSLYHGPGGTAAWVDRAIPGPSNFVVAAFPGYYNETNEVQLRVERRLDDANRGTCCDYDEVEGRVILQEANFYLYPMVQVYSFCSFDESRFAWKRVVDKQD